MGKKAGAKVAKLNKVKQAPGKFGGKKQQMKKFNKPSKSPQNLKSPKSANSSKNSSFTKNVKKGKVHFADDSVSSKKRGGKSFTTPNQSQKSIATSNASRVSTRKPTPFPKKVASLQNKKMKEVEEEEQTGSDDFEMSDVSFESAEESENEAMDYSMDDSMEDEEGSEEEEEDEESEEEEKQPVVPVKTKKEQSKNGANLKKPAVSPKVPEKTQPSPKAQKTSPAKIAKNIVDKAVKRKRQEPEMSALDYTNFNDNRRLFVTNMPDNVTEEELKGLHGGIEDFVFLSSFRKRRGSAIIVFRDESAAEKAKLELKGMKIRGKVITTDYVGAKNSKKSAINMGEVVGNRLYVGNMGQLCTEENLRKIFPAASQISVPLNKRHSFGFVEFADDSDAMAAIREKNYAVFNGEKIIVQFARAKAERVESAPKKAKVEESEGESELDDGEDIGEEDSEDESLGDDLESFDDDEDDE